MHGFKRPTNPKMTLREAVNTGIFEAKSCDPVPRYQSATFEEGSHGRQ